MHDMNTSNREDYDYRDDYRDSYRGGSYRDDYRDDYRDYRNYRNYRDDYRDYDRRGGRRNYRNYRNYREQDYYEELEMCMEDAREDSRKYEDLSEMAKNPQEKNNLMKISQREKEHYMTLKEMVEKGM